MQKRFYNLNLNIKEIQIFFYNHYIRKLVLKINKK